MEMPDPVESYCMRLNQRVIVGVLISSAVLVGFYQQKIFAASLRDMVYKKPPKLDPDSNSYCPFMLEMEAIETVHSPFSDQPDFFWEDDITRAITQAFFIGFFILSIPAGVMADYFGGRWFLGIGVLVLSICTLLFPILARPDPYLFIIGRLCQGAAQAIVLSSCIVLLAHWVPHSERATFLGVVYSMKEFGAILGQLQIHLFRQLELKWMALCYTSGTIGLICSLVLLIFLHDSPGRCPYLSKQEKYFIRTQTKSINYRQGKTDFKQLVPWRQMFSSKPFLAMLLFQFGWSWIRITLLNRLDNYLIHVVHLTRDLTYNCLAFTLFALGISSVVGGVVGDKLINSGLISRSTHRKMFGFLSNTLVLPLLLATVAAGCSGTVVCALYVVMLYINGFADCSFGANVLDLAPRHVGVSFAILNCTYACAVLFNKELFLVMCERQGDTSEWVKFYLACGAIVLTFSLPFLFFGSAEVQPYNIWDGRPIRDPSLHQEPNTQEGQSEADT